MKLSKKKYPYLFKEDLEWYFAKDYQGNAVKFTSEIMNEILHEISLIRDYFSLAILDKHFELFDKIDYLEVTEHWKRFQTGSYLIMNNEGESLLVEYDVKKDKFFFIAFKEFALAAMIAVSTDELNKIKGVCEEHYFSNMLSEEKRKDIKHWMINIFKISYCIKHFAPTELKIVDDKNRRVQMGKGIMNKVTADSGLIVPVNIIDSSYLTTIIHVNATTVRGHFRLQPYGKMSLDRKLIWIDPHEKQPYKRTAKKLDE